MDVKQHLTAAFARELTACLDSGVGGCMRNVGCWSGGCLSGGVSVWVEG